MLVIPLNLEIGTVPLARLPAFTDVTEPAVMAYGVAVSSCMGLRSVNAPGAVLTPSCNHRAAPDSKGVEPKSSRAVNNPLETVTVTTGEVFVATGCPPDAAFQRVGAISAVPV